MIPCQLGRGARTQEVPCIVEHNCIVLFFQGSYQESDMNQIVATMVFCWVWVQGIMDTQLYYALLRAREDVPSWKLGRRDIEPVEIQG